MMNVEMNVDVEMNIAEDVVFMKESNIGARVEAEAEAGAEMGADNCPICFETLNSTNIETIHGCGHEFCGDCVKVLRDRCDTYDSEGLGVKVVKCPMCRGTEAVSAEQLKKRVRELCTQKNLLAFEANDLRTKCKNMEKAFATIRKALPKTRDVNRAQRVRPGIDEAVEFAVREREEIQRRRQLDVERLLLDAEIRLDAERRLDTTRRLDNTRRLDAERRLDTTRRRLDVERRLGFVEQPAVGQQPVVEQQPTVEQPAVEQQPAVGQPAVRPIRRPRLGRRGGELGFCVVVGCRSKNRTVRLCDSCAEFCCARCKMCSTCRAWTSLI